MKSIIVDTGSVISLVTNNLLWLFKHLDKHYPGSFVIPGSVRSELIDYPMKTKKFKLESLMVNDLIMEGHFKVYDKNKEVSLVSDKLMDYANNMFVARGRPVKILQKAETDVLALAIHLKSDALLVDERALRLLVENPKKMVKILGGKLHTQVTINQNEMKEFSKMVKGINVLRSTELVTVAYELGLLDRYITAKKVLHKKYKQPLLEGALWALKLKGCSISSEEIDEILKFEGF